MGGGRPSMKPKESWQILPLVHLGVWSKMTRKTRLNDVAPHLIVADPVHSQTSEPSFLDPDSISILREKVK
jgi:hypothetical protein